MERVEEVVMEKEEPSVSSYKNPNSQGSDMTVGKIDRIGLPSSPGRMGSSDRMLLGNAFDKVHREIGKREKRLSVQSKKSDVGKMDSSIDLIGGYISQ